MSNLNPTYLKVRLAKGRTVIIRVSRRGRGLVSGYQTDKFGDEVGASRKTRVLVVVSEPEVVCEMVWNLKYAELEKKPCESELPPSKS